MRQRRIKISPEAGEAVYHAMSRTVNGERLFAESDREVLRNQIWLVAEYCGVQVLTYTILSNHFHVLLLVPQKTIPTDKELLRRYRLLYPKPTKYQTARLEVIEEQLKAGGEKGEQWRRQQLALMGDLSAYMKLMKQRFSIWFNKSHGRYGTLWAERFTSILIEPQKQATSPTSAYIDLNCVRAGLAEDPKDYRFCGYAEAVAGKTAAREGLQRIVGGKTWEETQSDYRQLLFSIGAGPRERGRVIPLEELKKVMATQGRLPLAEVLRCKVKYFTGGAVLGSKLFVGEQLVAYRQRTGQRVHTAPRLLPDIADWGDLAILRGIRGEIFG
ncbi:MAG TPA: transposase [Opitutaceae bacterium]|nr:transposase [Opitutaceae bacterium]